ncbi:MAG TPA: hypothetical protein VHV99_06085, partial [Paraburkholderia sp.]|nr:hypothetical protein [Paraburkholderia sp.]
VAIAESHYLVALHVFVTAEAEVIAAFFRRCCRAVAVNDRRIEKLILVQFGHRTEQYGIQTAIRCPAPENAVDARGMNFGATGRILVDRQRLSLAAQIEHLQNVVEDLAQGQFGHRSTVPTREMRQDKFVELRIAQLHWNAVPRLAFGHLGPKASRF